MGGRLHGVRVRRLPEEDNGTSGASQVVIRRIHIRHEGGGSVCFVPEAREEFFSQDDAHRVVGLLRAASGVLEWGLKPEHNPDASTYDTGGAV